jgi:hypothetical protein
MKIFFANGSLSAWLAKAIGALRNWNRVQVTHTAPVMHNVRQDDVPQITSGWDYRPRDIIRRDKAFERGATRGAELARPSTPNENDNVWFSFRNPEPTIEEATPKTPWSNDASAVSTYD